MVVLVSDHGLVHRLVERGAPDVGAAYVPVVVEEDTTGLEVLVGRDRERAEKPVPSQVDVIAEHDRQAERVVPQRHRRNQAVLLIAELAHPGGVIEPGELAVEVETGAAKVAHRVVCLADAREEDVAHGVRGVEADEHAAVADDQAARHFRAHRRTEPRT